MLSWPQINHLIIKVIKGGSLNINNIYKLNSNLLIIILNCFLLIKIIIYIILKFNNIYKYNNFIKENQENKIQAKSIINKEKIILFKFLKNHINKNMSIGIVNKNFQSIGVI